MARKSPKKTDHSYYELVSVVGVLETIFNPRKEDKNATCDEYGYQYVSS